MKIKLFTKKDCPRCPEARAVTAGLEDLELYDIEEVDGLTEAAFYGVLSTPSIVLVNDAGKEVASWRGEVPSKDELAAQILQ